MGIKRKEYFGFNTEEVLETVEYLEFIHGNIDECFVRVLSKQRGKARAYNINTIKDEEKLENILRSFGTKDVMISFNTFKTMKSGRRTNLFTINAVAVDIDYKNLKSYSDDNGNFSEPLQIIAMLEQYCFDVSIPVPNFIEYGNQLRLIYVVNTAYVPKGRDNVVVLSSRISKVFAEDLSEFGAEAQMPESYIRVPGTINSKNGAEVKVLSYMVPKYELRDIQECWMDLPKYTEGRKKGRNQVSKPKKAPVKLHNLFILNTNRLRDFEKIQKYLNELGEVDLRARLCFLYRNYVLVLNYYQNGTLTDEDFEEAKIKMLKFNKGFVLPLRENLIESATRNVNRRQYLYKNESILDLLNRESTCGIDFTWELCDSLELDSLYKPKSKEERDKDYYQRNRKNKNSDAKKRYKEKLKAVGIVMKKQAISKRREKIKGLIAQGLKGFDICTQLDISKRTYIRDRKFLKEQGLI